MGKFRAVASPAEAESHKSPALREAESFMRANARCMRCKSRPSSVMKCRAARRIALCGPCNEWFDAPPAQTRRDDPAAAARRAVALARMRYLASQS